MTDRWIRVSVETFEHELLGKGPFDRRSAWLWLVAHAKWKDTRVNHKGRPLELKRGQLLAGRAFLAEAWGWGEKQVRIFMELLQSENMIKKGQSSGHYANVITICNYDKYQTAEKEHSQSDGQSGASAGPERGQTFTKDTSTTNRNNNSASPESDAAREVLADPFFEKCKLSLNGTTTRLLDVIRNADGPYGTRARAAEQVSDMLDDIGADALLDAFKFYERKIAKGESVKDVRAFLDRTARAYVANRGKSLAAKAEADTKAYIDRMKRFGRH